MSFGAAKRADPGLRTALADLTLPIRDRCTTFSNDAAVPAYDDGLAKGALL
jgi:hypothetical protein